MNDETATLPDEPTGHADPQGSTLILKRGRQREIPTFEVAAPEFENAMLRSRIVRGSWLIGTNAATLAVCVGIEALANNSGYGILTVAILGALVLGCVIVGVATSRREKTQIPT